MKRAIVLGTLLFAQIGFAAEPADPATRPDHVSYVIICPTANGGYYYIPDDGSTSTPCLNEATGITINTLPNGSTVNGQSMLAYQVSQLEQQIAMLENELKE